MNFEEKLKLMRRAEGLNQVQLADATGIPLSTLKKIEAGYHEPGWGVLSKITQHPQFEKYTLWLMTGNAAPEAGQIAPEVKGDAEVPSSKHKAG